MGWLFGKKKVPRVPLPPGRLIDSSSLHFPEKIVRDKIIEPETEKGMSEAQDFFPPPEARRRKMPIFAKKPASEPFPREMPASPANNFLYVKVEVYRRIWGELNGLRTKLGELNRINKHLEHSEFNEEHNFDKLSKAIKAAHDRLQQVDRKLFKR